MKRIRCAIYTRKSSEEGLEQGFNSLHAQREACAAYVLSQASEGWTLLPDHYDDGGLSGGTLERPALRRLLADIAAQKIDIIVVYKVDRLTRSLLDFAKLVEAFDGANTSFVSITQSFNTTTSMGRLTLNMLLSFAQFEREVTSERIRDKIAASKAKGMWMGGTPPLGYSPDGRSLAIFDEHAALVRDIYQRYLETGNVRLLANELDREAIKVPRRQSASGRTMGGGIFTRGQLYKLLSNPIYVGEIHHRGIAYQGQHDAIIDREAWDAVQQRLADNRQGIAPAISVKSPSLFAGLIFDEKGEPLVAAHATKGKVRYRYYVSRSLQHDPNAISPDGLRIPAREIEAAVVSRIEEALCDPLTLLAQAGITLEADYLNAILHRAERLVHAIRSREWSSLRQLVVRVEMGSQGITIDLSSAVIAETLGCETSKAIATTLTLSAPVRLTRTGRAVRLIQRDGRASTTDTVDATLIQLLVRARSWWAQLATGETDIASLARREQLNDSWISRVVRLNFLAPSLVEAILDGKQPAHLDATRLVTSGVLPPDWREQLTLLSQP
jgi:DNA invertase Pin-like site-specific DNA recombinase